MYSCVKIYWKDSRQKGVVVGHVIDKQEGSGRGGAYFVIGIKNIVI